VRQKREGERTRGGLTFGKNEMVKNNVPCWGGEKKPKEVKRGSCDRMKGKKGRTGRRVGGILQDHLGREVIEKTKEETLLKSSLKSSGRKEKRTKRREKWERNTRERGGRRGRLN